MPSAFGAPSKERVPGHNETKPAGAISSVLSSHPPVLPAMPRCAPGILKVWNATNLSGFFHNDAVGSHFSSTSSTACWPSRTFRPLSRLAGAGCAWVLQFILRGTNCAGGFYFHGTMMLDAYENGNAGTAFSKRRKGIYGNVIRVRKGHLAKWCELELHFTE